MTRRPRLLFYAVNGLGLGHVTRLLAIARAVRRRAPEAEIVFLTSSEADDVIFREGFAAFKVPSKTLRAESGLRASTYARMLQTLALNLLASFHPHVLVVDTFPAGIIQELLPVLRWDSRKAFVYRAQRAETAMAPLFQNTLALYDLAIVPHALGSEEIFLPEGIEQAWTGPILIRDGAEAKPREEAREILGLPAEGRILYVSFGGGGDREMDASLEQVIEGLAGKTETHLALAQAPLYRGRIRRRAGVSLVDYYPMSELFGAFDAAFSAAGYNSAMELLHHGVPTAFLSFPRQADNQEARVLAIEEAGAGLALPNLAPESLQATLVQLLDPNTAQRLREHGRAMVPDSGADRAAEALLRLVP